MTHPSSTAATTFDRICRVGPLVVLARRHELKCTERELRAAVDSVGSEPSRVRLSPASSSEENLPGPATPRTEGAPVSVCLIRPEK
ncbi:DUF3606 domain-containing protein [Polaromonas sp. AET17H-212]|uniref:DUF3606 domain-containing protein n=1 Tax=Polaromonas sp. AET17H-212 TaxID=1977061 RepID=UPI0011446954